MGFKPDFVEDRLRRKFGFEEARNRGKKHKYYVLQISDDLPLIETFFSHDGKEIREALEGRIRRELRVRKDFFYGMMECTKSREDYYRQIREAPYPPFEDYLLRRLPKKDK